MRRRNLHGRRMAWVSDGGVFGLASILCLSCGALAQGQELPRIVIAPEPVGSGARALGQSAFIAVADDATAASWNPAGLINLERPEASLVGAWKSTTYDYSSADARISADADSWSEGQINFMSYAHPLRVGATDAVVSVNYHQIYDFGLELEYKVRDVGFTVEGSSQGATSAYSLAGALSIPSRPEITVGASFNWHTQSLLNDYAWKTKMTLTTDSGGSIEHTETFHNFRGYNFTFGVLWDAYERGENLLTLGFVCHTPFTAKVDREEAGFPDDGRRRGLEMDFPFSLGTGVNYRFSDSFSIAFDADWTQWSQFEERDPNGTRSRPIGEGEGLIADTLAFRLGGEYLWFSKPGGQSVYALRGGIFYEPRPALDDAMPVYGISLGAGWTLKKRFSLDFAYQFRWGDEISGRNLGQGIREIDYYINEHFFVASLITYF